MAQIFTTKSLGTTKNSETIPYNLGPRKLRLDRENIHISAKITISTWEIVFQENLFK